MKSVVLYVAYLLLLPAVTLAFSDDADVDDLDDLGRGSYARTRRGWSMMRLGRGLQMLRLGKRSFPTPYSHTSTERLARQLPIGISSHASQATPEQMRQLLGDLLEESRQDFRRQPPMPRYGRELEEDEEETLEELYDLLKDRPSKRQPYAHADRVQRSVPDHASVHRESSSMSDQAKDTFSAGS
ncbi:hypothetical protein ACOMHN_026628 [Nucella lapillus]